MNTEVLDLTTLLPQRYRDKTLDGIIKNLFNRFTSERDSINVSGRVGASVDLQVGEVEITERNLERQLNQLTPIVYAEHGTERQMASWQDLLQKLVLLGVDPETIGTWFSTISYNLVPPVDLDKFCNFTEYYWVGQWLLDHPSADFTSLGIPTVSYVTDALARSDNVESLPEYFVINHGSLSGGVPVSIQPDLAGWSDWSLVNLWVHREDAIEFIRDSGGLFGFDDLTQATRPILEYFRALKLNTRQTDGRPSETGTLRLLEKTRRNQLPLFDLYRHDLSHLGKVSAIFYYAESTDEEIDEDLQRRVIKDDRGDFSFDHSLVNPDSGELYYYKTWDGVQFHPNTIWAKGAVVSPRYVKYDVEGTLINVDKLTNYTDYFWTGVTLPTGSLPSYNQTGLAEYVVIEAGGTSGWSTYNFWKHVSELDRSRLKTYAQATKPIIEFNVGLEPELTNTKTTFGQLPTFRLYRSDGGGNFELLPSVTEPNLNDAYSEGTLFARVEELRTAAVINQDPNLLVRTVTLDNGEVFFQSLYSGVYLPERNGITYGYTADVTEFQGDGDGGVTLVAGPVCVPQVIFLTWNGASFTAVGTVSGSLGTVPLSATTTIAGLDVTPTAGVTPFSVGDVFTLHLKSYVFEPRSVYAKLGPVYRTLSSPDKILDTTLVRRIVEADPELGDGVWEVPPQLLSNVQNETRVRIKQGDLYFHLISIIGGQLDLEGSATGSNNWRELPVRNYGARGIIKQFDQRTNLLVSFLMQEGVTVAALLEFMRESYANLSNTIKTFIKDRVPALLLNGSFTPPLSGTDVDAGLVTALKEYISNTSPVTTASPGTVDDHVATLFFDGTSPIYNLVMTLPYFLGTGVTYPDRVVDLEQNMEVIVHHDGHQSPLPTVDGNLLKGWVSQMIERSHGGSTPGVITAGSYPALPYKGMLWYKTTTGQLFYYNVISDTGEQPDDAEPGDYSYDRQNNALYQFTGSWVNLGSTAVPVALPFYEVKTDLIEQNLTLALERELYENYPPLAPRLTNVATLEADPAFNELMQVEFERFGVRYDITDLYGGVYNPTNAFTWNYSGVTATGAGAPHAAWQEVYLDVYGTSRPDVQPWIPAGFADEATFIADLVANSAVPPLTTEWDVSLWSGAATYIKTLYAGNGVTTFLSVEVSAGALIPPYDFGVTGEAVVSTQPPGIGDPFEFLELGPVERFWRTTLDYLTSKQKVYFKMSPLLYVSELWGDRAERVGGYLFTHHLKRKGSSDGVWMNGDPLPDFTLAEHLETAVVSVPDHEVTYEVEYVSRINQLFKVTGSDLVGPVFVTESAGYADAYVQLTFTPTIQSYYVGDRFLVTLTADGEISHEIVPEQMYLSEGLNQIYVQYLRSYGEDFEISLNRSLFRDWELKLGYRFDSMISTDSLKVTAEGNRLAEADLKILIKENKFQKSAWINALRVQMVRRGTQKLVNGLHVPHALDPQVPGFDYVFRVDVYNPRRPELTWYTYDTDGPFQTFTPLNGLQVLTTQTYKLYKTVTGTQTVSAPFLVTGIQELITLVQGYSEWLRDQGWAFSDAEHGNTDPETGRPLNFQLTVEKLVTGIYAGAFAGYTHVLNPHARKVWYRTPRGMVSDLNARLGIDQETTVSVIGVDGRQIPGEKIRVFREDEITEVISDEPIYVLHLLVSEYEHVLLLEDYAIKGTLLYDPFLGQRASSLFLAFERQETTTGRTSYGGKFLLGDETKSNLEGSVDELGEMYSFTNNRLGSPMSTRALKLLGFESKSYFQDRGTSEQAEFRFWQGLTKNKGTNLAVNNFTNSKKLKGASLDEFWAFKLADYGDSREVKYPELRVLSDDVTGDLTNYLFLEPDEETYVSQFAEIGGYDVPTLDVIPYDITTIFDITHPEVENEDLRGTILILSGAEDRWETFRDLHLHKYVEAALLTEMELTPQSLEEIFTVTYPDGTPVKADIFELVNVNYVGGEDSLQDLTSEQVYREHGDVTDRDLETYADPKFVRLNSSTIQILDGNLVGGYDIPLLDAVPYDDSGTFLKVRAYGPPIFSYSPTSLFDRVNKVQVKNDLIWWDPARGSHSPYAVEAIDITQATDPAVYNKSVLGSLNRALEPWGAEAVGKIWWDTEDLDWKPYHDTKVNPEMFVRLASWGALAEHSKINLYEWIEADVKPENYDGDGFPARWQLLTRTRTWEHRPVAWRFSENPVLTPRTFKTYQPSTLKISLTDYQGKAILSTGSFTTLGLREGDKIAGVTYGSTSKVDANIVDVYGTAILTASIPDVEIGSATVFEGGAGFVSSVYFTFDLQVDRELTTLRPEALGQYVLSSEIEDSLTYLRLTHVTTQKTERLRMNDTPVTANTQDTYRFNQLGITLLYVALYGQTDTWPSLGVPSESLRISTAAAALGNAGHQIYLRSSLSVFAPVSFGGGGTAEVTLDGTEVTSTGGWIAWTDPLNNPIKGAPPPNNKYLPIVGDWIPVGDVLSDVAADITERIGDRWVGFDGTDFVPYRPVWGIWSELKKTVTEATYATTLATEHAQFFINHFTVSDIGADDLTARATVYVWGSKTDEWTVTTSGDDAVLTVDASLLSLGDKIRMEVGVPLLSQDDVEFDPDVKEDPLRLTQYKKSVPYTEVKRRDGPLSQIKTTYCFWVRDKLSNADIKKISITQASQLLSKYDDVYAVPQLVKRYNEIDARPNRYGIVSFTDLSRYVGVSDRYKLRLTRNSTLRHDDRDIKLKNTHSEWVLIRPYQPTKIPFQLWELLTDTLVGADQINGPLPGALLVNYDDRNDTNARYGSRADQVLTDPGAAREIVEYTLNNTQLTKVVNGVVTPDYVSYTGFDLAEVDTYLSTETTIREFMADMWRFAKPKQVNEVFFAVLEDAVVKTQELERFFKTSWISLSGVVVQSSIPVLEAEDVYVPPELITVGTGGMSFTGRVPTLNREYNIGPEAGSLTIIVLTPVNNLGLWPDTSSSLLVTGGDAVTIGEAFSPGTYNFLITGQGLDVDRIIDVGTTSMSIIGRDVLLMFIDEPNATPMMLTGETVSIALSFALGTGSLTIESEGAEVSDIEDVGTVDLVLTGSTPTLDEGYLLDVGGLTLASDSFEILITVLTDPGTQSLTLVGGSVNIPDLYLDAPAGSIIFTGAVPTLDRTYLIETPEGVLALSGETLIVSIQDADESGTASLILVGEAGPSMLFNMLERPPVRNMTFTGAGPGLLFNMLERPPAGSMTFTGVEPNLSLRIGIPKGTLTLTGSGPTDFDELFSFPAAGTLLITGLTPSISIGEVPFAPTYWLMALTGETPSLAFSILPAAGQTALVSYEPTSSIGPEAGELTLAGAAPTLHSMFSVEVGQLMLIGRSSSIDLGFNGEPENLEFTGEAGPGLLFNMLERPPAGSMALVGSVPTLPPMISVETRQLMLIGGGSSFNVTFIEVSGSLTLAGMAGPGLLFNMLERPPAGSMTFTGAAGPSMLFNMLERPPVRNMTFVGSVPTIGDGNVIEKGTLTLTSSAPTLALVAPVGTGQVIITLSTPGIGEISPAAGDLALTGQATSFDLGITEVTGTISLTGDSLTFNLSFVVGEGALAMVGEVPTVNIA